MSTVIVYFHGYGSSAQTDKVQKLRDAGYTVYCWTYDTDTYPVDNIDYLDDCIYHLMANDIESEHKYVFVGTSLGAWYAARLAKLWYCKTVLINPAVDPGVSLAKFGVATDVLEQYTPLEFSSRDTVVLGTNDELFDFSRVDFCGARHVYQVEGGDHRMSEKFDRVLEFIREI